MNAIYSYNPQEASAIVISRIYHLLELNHWSVKTLSDKSDIPYETLKKLLARKIENTSIHNIIKIACAFHCNVDDLVGFYGKTLDSPLSGSIHTKFLWNYFNEIDTSLDSCIKTPVSNCIPLLNPVSNALTTALDDSSKLDMLDISSYPPQVVQEVEYGIIVSSFCYHPAYYNRDILLVSKKRFPLPGETAVLLHRGELYIRIFSPSCGHVLLESVNGIGPDIKIYDFSDWIIWGYVVGVHRL